MREELKQNKYNMYSFANIKEGTFHRVVYITGPDQKGLNDIHYEVAYTVQFCDHESREPVKENRALGIMPNCPAAEGEEPTEVKHVFIHKKTKRVKLRLPLAGMVNKGIKTYFQRIGYENGKPIYKEIDKDVYYDIYKQRGYKIPKKAELKPNQIPYRSLDIDYIKYFK